MSMFEMFRAHRDAGNCRIPVREVQPPPASRGQCWEIAHAETIGLPSWERGQAARRRYDELVANLGVTHTVTSR